jgi:hypothetical protein
VLIILAQNACTGLLHRLSLVSPAGLADGLALKEVRYTESRDSPQAYWPTGPPRPDSPPRASAMDAAMLAVEITARTEKARCFRAFCNIPPELQEFAR